MHRSRAWSISGWPAVVLSPLAILWALALKFLPLKKTRNRTPGEVAGYIQDFFEGTGGEWDWDDFTSIAITDSRLDTIRQEACQVQLPLREDGKEKLKKLMLRARSIRPLS
jgi:hypothetical protein